MKGEPVQNAHPIIRMFSLCENMKWAHLPNDGGLYDQNPDLLEGFRHIFSARAEENERQRAADEAKQRRPRSPGIAGSRRR